MGRVLVHLATRAAWARAREKGRYIAESYKAEGFHHCSEPHQLRDVADRLFVGRSDLVLLEIDEDRLGVEVRRENLEGGTELYPHIYGPIAPEAVVATRRLESGEDGRLLLPGWVEAAS